LEVVVVDLIVQDLLLVDLADQVVAELMVVLVALEQWDKDLLAELQPLQTQVAVAAVLVTWALLVQVDLGDQELILLVI
jgi:hypothetical protein